MKYKTQDNMLGRVIKLFITRDNKDKTRESVEKFSADEFGILNDKFYKKNPMRTILITSIQSYELTQEHGIEIEYGALGENILIDINPYSLVEGDTFTIGTTEFEITQNCTLCKGLSTINPKLPTLLKKDRGIFAKIIKGSNQISIGDKIKI